MVRKTVGLGAAGVSAAILAGALAKLVTLRGALVNERPTFPQPDAGLVLAHEGRAGGRVRTTYVTRKDLQAEKEALGAALIGALALAGSLLIAPPVIKRRYRLLRPVD